MLIKRHVYTMNGLAYHQSSFYCNSLWYCVFTEESQVHPDSKDSLDPRESKVHKDPQDSLVLLDLLDPEVIQDKMEHLEMLENLDHPDLMVSH